MAATSKDLSLSELLAPVSPGQLRAEHWGRCSMYLPGDPARLTAWRHREGWRCWVLHDVHAASLDADGVQQREAIELDQLDASLAAGRTICGDASTDRRLGRVLADLTANVAASGARPFAKLYISPPGRGYVLHADRYHVLVVQLSGRKRWWFGERPAVIHAMAGAEVTAQGEAVLTHPYQGAPMRADDGALVQPPTDDALREVVLSPGGCLYLPPGTWHRTEAVSTSVALSLSPPRTPLAERLMGALVRMVVRDPRWRADLEGDDAAAALTARVHDLRARLGDLDPTRLARAWAIEHEQRLATLARPSGSALGSALAPARPSGSALAPSGTLARPSGSALGSALTGGEILEREGDRPLRWLVAPDDEGGRTVLFFYGGGQEWSLPLVARPLVETLASTPRFEVQQALAWAPELDPKDVMGVLSELLRVGVLRRAERDAAG